MELINYGKEMWDLALQGEGRGIFFWGSIYFLLMLLYSLIRQMRTYTWPDTIGTLVDSEIKKFGGTEWAKTNQDYVVSALYTYTVDNKLYQGKRVSPWVFVTSHNMKRVLEKQMQYIQRYGEDKVKVFYNPRNPKKSFLIKPGRKGQLFTAFLAVMPLAMYLSKYHA